MKKYGGQLIYSTRDEYGPLEVVEIQQVARSLHFGNTTQQSAMFLYNPIVLMHKYTQAMLTPLSWIEAKHVLALGLGAASIPKFLLHHFRNTFIDAVELRPSVVDIAKEYFSLHVDEDRLKLHICSADEFISQQDINYHYDLILVDLFITVNEKDINVDIATNMQRLYHMLGPHGCLCINLLGEDFMKYSGLGQLMDVFDGEVYAIPVAKSNTILMASRGVVPGKFNDIDFTTLELKYSLPFRQYYDLMKKI